MNNDNDSKFIDYEFVDSVKEEERNKQKEAMPNSSFHIEEGINIPNKGDIELGKAFIGKNYEKIVKGGFSLWGFLFKSTYFFYRKMYFKGMIIGIMSYLILIIPSYKNIPINLIIHIIYALIVGASTKGMYLKYANDKLTEIRNNNPMIITEDLIEPVKKMGGTSIIAIFVCSAILSAIIKVIGIFLANGGLV